MSGNRMRFGVNTGITWRAVFLRNLLEPRLLDLGEFERLTGFFSPLSAIFLLLAAAGP